MAQDTRKDPRAKVLSMTVRYKSATVDEFIEHHSHDVSRGGIFIKTPSPFPAGTLLKFEIRLQDEQAVIAGVGRVVWKREADQSDDERPSGMGVKFIKIDDKSKALITRLVESQGAGSAFEAGLTGAEQEDDGAGAGPLPAAPAAAAGAQPAGKGSMKRASTMLGLGTLGSGATGATAAQVKAEPKKAEGGGSFFPQTNPEKEMPPPEERTMMKQAAELLKQALAEAGESIDDVKQTKEPLLAPEPKKEPKAEVKKEEPAKPIAARISDRPTTPEPLASQSTPAIATAPDEGESEEELREAMKKAAAAAAATREEPASTREIEAPASAKSVREEAKTLDERPKAKAAAAATKRTDEKPVQARPASIRPPASIKPPASVKPPLMQEEESSGAGRILTILLVAAALGGALWLFLGQGDSKDPTPPPAPTAAAPTTTPAPTQQPQQVVPTITDTAKPADTAAPGVSAAPTTSAATPPPEPTAKPTAEPTAKPTAEPAAAPTAEPTAKPTAAPKATPPKPPAAPKPPPAAPKPKPADDPYG